MIVAVFQLNFIYTKTVSSPKLARGTSVVEPWITESCWSNLKKDFRIYWTLESTQFKLTKTAVYQIILLYFAHSLLPSFYQTCTFLGNNLDITASFFRYSAYFQLKSNFTYNWQSTLTYALTISCASTHYTFHIFSHIHYGNLVNTWDPPMVKCQGE